MDILIGTKNQYKATEMAAFLSGLSGINIHFLEELKLDLKITEDQPTLKQNAEKKAVGISKLTDWYVLASDGGVDIPGLGAKWDILRNQRIVGEDKTDLEKAEKLLSLMQGLKGDQRKAVYRLALALAKNGRLIYSSEQVTDRGFIADRLINKNIPAYRWMGHLWYYPEYHKVFYELNEAEKQQVRKQGAGLKRELNRVITALLK